MQDITRAALSVLVVLQAVMLAALFTKTEPHPPAAITLFAMGPFLASAIALAIAGFILCDQRKPLAISTVLLAAIAALISFGPQKWFDPAIREIWPAVALAQVATGALFWTAIIAYRGKSSNRGHIND